MLILDCLKNFFIGYYHFLKYCEICGKRKAEVVEPHLDAGLRMCTECYLDFSKAANHNHFLSGKKIIDIKFSIASE